MLELLVVLLARLLVLRERRATARAPLRRAVALVEPAARLRLLEEAPNVGDVGVRESEVVVAPVHPLAEALRLPDHDSGEFRDEVAAVAGEAGEPVILDLVLRVEPEGLLDLHLDVEPLRVEPVLVPELVAVHGLVALEDVLEGAPDSVVDTGGRIRGDRPVHEREGRAATVLLAQLRKRALGVPAREHPVLERRMIRFVR